MLNCTRNPPHPHPQLLLSGNLSKHVQAFESVISCDYERVLLLLGKRGVSCRLILKLFVS